MDSYFGPPWYPLSTWSTRCWSDLLGPRERDERHSEVADLPGAVGYCGRLTDVTGGAPPPIGFRGQGGGCASGRYGASDVRTNVGGGFTIYSTTSARPERSEHPDPK